LHILTLLTFGRSRMVQMAIRDLHCTSGRRELLTFLRGRHRRNFWLHPQDSSCPFTFSSWSSPRAVAWRRGTDHYPFTVRYFSFNIGSYSRRWSEQTVGEGWSFEGLGFVCLKIEYTNSAFCAGFKHAPGGVRRRAGNLNAVECLTLWPNHPIFKQLRPWAAAIRLVLRLRNPVAESYEAQTEQSKPLVDFSSWSSPCAVAWRRGWAMDGLIYETRNIYLLYSNSAGLPPLTASNCSLFQNWSWREDVACLEKILSNNAIELDILPTQNGLEWQCCQLWVSLRYHVFRPWMWEHISPPPCSRSTEMVVT